MWELSVEYFQKVSQRRHEEKDAPAGAMAGFIFIFV